MARIEANHIHLRRRRLEHQIARLLATSGALVETVPKLLQMVAEAFDWDVAEFWEVLPTARELRMVHVWHVPGRKLAAYVDRSLRLSVSMFDGLPGHVMTTRKAAWIPDLARWPSLARKRDALRAGLKSAVAFPIVLGRERLGVMAFLGHRLTAPDKPLLEMFESLGSQIGQFMERRRTEQALREADEFSKQVINGAQAGIVVYDREGRFLVWNPFMEHLTGYRAEETLGRPALEVFPFLRHEHFETLFERALAGEVFEAADISFRLPERGKSGVTAARFAPLRNARQEVVGVIVAVRDITERRRLESELLEISDREQRRIGHDLHDGLGQQLTGLEMKCFLLLQDLAEADLTARREALQAQARRISRELRQCITATRSLARGLAPMTLKTDGLVGALRQLAGNVTVPGKIRCRLVCASPPVLDNSETAGHLYRIAQEAVHNALKHACPRSIQIRLAHDAAGLRLQIRDDGRGLPARGRSGSGMGLEVMRHRAHVIGGTLHIESKAGRGVTITCIVPLKPVAP